jgi:hypothetical protein
MWIRIKTKKLPLNETFLINKSLEHQDIKLG